VPLAHHVRCVARVAPRLRAVLVHDGQRRTTGVETALEHLAIAQDSNFRERLAEARAIRDRIAESAPTSGERAALVARFAALSAFADERCVFVAARDTRALCTAGAIDDTAYWTTRALAAGAAPALDARDLEFIAARWLSPLRALLAETHETVSVVCTHRDAVVVRAKNTALCEMEWLEADLAYATKLMGR
jgi:hypothetical protein